MLRECALWWHRFRGSQPAAQLPDLDAIQAEEVAGAPAPRPQRKSDGTKRENNDLRLIGALLLFVEGKLSLRKHPDFTSQAKLGELLREGLDKCPGLGESTLEERFKAAREAVDNYRKNV